MKQQEISFPLTNQTFLKVISNSFCSFLEKGTSRSTDKLKPLHGAIARDLKRILGPEYTVISQGYGEDREEQIPGRYINKWVDITVKKGLKAVGGIAVKFVMQNYSQNSNNYFENMLGETANIRAAKCPYFQIFIILDKLPYYKKDTTKSIQKWETFTEHNASKYVTLSKDNIDVFFHTPNKTLIYVVHIPDNESLSNQSEYMEYYRNLDFSIIESKARFDSMESAVILNDYETFIEKVNHTIKAL
ncbi:MAG: hypothetical protein GX899_05760 [Rikenellaceae bacterium]|jgi:hypothetical protein|nr:hypothetical protein [Rikenellaceae bacterium]